MNKQKLQTAQLEIINQRKQEVDDYRVRKTNMDVV